MLKANKTTVVENLKSAFNEARLVIITKQTGLSVAKSNQMRSAVRQNGGSFQIAKNSLARIAAKETPAQDLIDYFTGPTGIAIANEDSVGLAKALVDFSKDNDKLEILAGVLDGKILPANDIVALSKLPSLDELRGKIVGLIQAPATKIAGITQAPASQLARLFSAYASKEN